MHEASFLSRKPFMSFYSAHSWLTTCHGHMTQALIAASSSDSRGISTVTILSDSVHT